MKTGKGYALITGATSGIGYELAKLFAQDGYNLVIVSRGADELQNTASQFQSQHNVQVETIAKDLFIPESAFEVYEEIKKKNIKIDILVNNAGQGEYGEFVETDIRKELDIIQLNISSVVVLTKLFLKDMVERREGRILNVASIASKIPGPWQAVYHGTKAFVHSFTEAIRAEVRDAGVIVTSLLPGVTDTDFFNKAHMKESKVVEPGKMADPTDVAKDGFDALMSGDDKVVSGAKNKAQVAMSNITPDSTLADSMYKQQAPKEEK
jgi:uncharacterized protein